MPVVTAFRWVPPVVRGLVRDLRVRWALEEAGIAYEAKLIDLEEKQSEAYRHWQPFGQVPAYRDDTVELFESGAIVDHIAQQSEALMPRQDPGRQRTRTWIFAALNSVEPPVQELGMMDFAHSDEAWTRERRPQVEAFVRQRLAGVAGWLDGRDWLEDRFTAGDLMMASVLRILHNTNLVAETPTLAAYLERCTSRPAFERALADHLRPFAEA